MKTALIASLVASATAFAPASQSGRASMALNLDITKEIGVQVRFNTNVLPCHLPEQVWNILTNVVF